MIKKCFLGLILFLQFGCVRKNSHIENESSIVDSIDYTYETAGACDKQVVESVSDDIYFSYTSISKSEYERLKENSKNEILNFPQEKFEETDKGLTIKLVNGKTLSFLNNDGIECESCLEIYRYVGYSVAHNIHIYSKKLYESTKYFLVNEQGITYRVFGKPSFLKDGYLMFCSARMLGIEGEPNGFQLYTMKDGNVKLIKQEDLVDWIPNYAFWISNNELVMEQDFPYDYYKDRIPPSKYVKIKIIGE